MGAASTKRRTGKSSSTPADVETTFDLDTLDKDSLYRDEVKKYFWDLVKEERYGELDPWITKFGANVSTYEYGVGGETFLTYAAQYNKVNLARYLLDRGADVYKTNYTSYRMKSDTGGQRPIHVAAMYGSLDVLKLLIEHPNGCYANILDQEVGDDFKCFKTPMDYAFEAKQTKIVEFLKDHLSKPGNLFYYCITDPEFCKESFQDREEWLRHMVRAHGSVGHCRRCLVRFENLDAFKGHVLFCREYHKGPTKYDYL